MFCSSDVTPDVPVVLIIFKRNSAIEVVRGIRSWSPKRLYIIADGGRPPDEHRKCLDVRKKVEESIDWPCQVVKLYSDRNQGCRDNISTGLTKVFQDEERAIILEDDCVPSPSFFPYCEELLDRFETDERIMTISGANYLPDQRYFGKHSYLFSGYAEQCGWATWRRAWEQYDVSMSSWPSFRDFGGLDLLFLKPSQSQYWYNIFQKAYDGAGGFSSWAYPWLFMCLTRNALSIVPRVNLITNVGFTPEGTHTTSSSSPLANVPSHDFEGELIHPPFVLRNDAFDSDYGKLVFYNEGITAYRLMKQLGEALSQSPRSISKEATKKLKRRLDPTDLGSLRRVEPVSRLFGYDRGTPIDRYYIERFLQENASRINGAVLEVGDSTYTERFGKNVRQSDVVHAVAGNPEATIVGNIETGENLPTEGFDCVILTQTLQFIYDLNRAVGNIHRILKPGGVALVTIPGISQISRYDMDRWGEYWRFTTMSARRLFETLFSEVSVEAYGNHIAAVAFLEGMAREELEPRLLDIHDPDYEVLITIRAVKT